MKKKTDERTIALLDVPGVENRWKFSPKADKSNFCRLLSIKLLSKMGAGATEISGSINQIEHCARRSRSLCWRRAVSKD
ncbi:hypothetical protein T11_1612 [Trichinella zimbabwensis]|uniref:Uncharacterized protein n=1 Tax=Trichinella zimbabwensis TaxID=268475 RepID=A0A0V1GZK6_9BILA|nr:hypothetical protein T11_1612 [Trichinella zimbabwensis]